MQPTQRFHQNAAGTEILENPLSFVCDSSHKIGMTGPGQTAFA
jgi:hypothetical protein